METVSKTIGDARIADAFPVSEEERRTKVFLLLFLLIVVSLFVNSVFFVPSAQADESSITLGGFILSNTYYNDSGVNNTDIPNFATSDSKPAASIGTFGGTVRQSRLTLKASGPKLDDVLGSAKTSAVLEVDFLGEFPNSTFAGAQPQPRLRLAYAKMDWSNTSLTAGQDWIILAPLNPTSLAHQAIAPLSSSGNLWNRMPQIRVDQNIYLDGFGKLLLTAGILRPIAGDNWTNGGAQQLDISGSGEQTTHPFYQGRIALSVNVLNQPATLGLSGHYGNENTTIGTTLETSAGALDLTLPLGPVTLTGEAFTGKNLDQFLGGVLQGVNPATLGEISSKGGWSQISFTPFPAINLNLAYGIDQPEIAQLNNGDRSKNQTLTANLIWKLGPRLSSGIEYNNIKTDYKNLSSGEDNYYNLAVIYYF
ncbi:MAG: hypothetical protein ACYDBV_03960 [Nitrospiria bacterium]